MTYVVCPSCGRMWETTKTWFEKCPKCGKQVFIPWNKVKPTTTTSSTTKTTTKAPTTKPNSTTDTQTTTTFPPIARVRNHKEKPSKKRLN
jgi:predicted  nucleic acid-binding Zn-ribbon protein